MSETAPARIECKATRDPLIRLGFVVAMLLGFGLWCIYEMSFQNKYPKPTLPLMDDLNGWCTWGMNFYGQFVFTALGLLVAWRWVKAKNRVFVADENGLGYVGQPQTPWSAVTELDLSRFKSKEILVLKTADGSITLDGWKLTNFRELVTKIETALPEVERTGL